MTKKIAIILSGGGMTSVYSAGAVSALVNEHQFTTPDIMIASSGGAGTGTYFVSGQVNVFKLIWTEILTVNNFVNFFRFWKMINIDYLIDTVFKELVPLKFNKIYSSKIDFLVPVINYKSGYVKYFSNHSYVDVFEAMRASKYIPMVVRGSVQIDGQAYGDSELSSDPDFHTMKAIELGATHVLVIDTDGFGFLTKTICRTWAFLKSGVFKKNYHAQLRKLRDFKIPSQVKVLKISPQKRPVTGPITNNQKKLQATFAQGYQECRDSQELKDFLNDYLQ